jgi:hypothetical protein
MVVNGRHLSNDINHLDHRRVEVQNLITDLERFVHGNLQLLIPVKTHLIRTYPSLMNFAFVTHRVAVGTAILTHADSQELVDAEITHVIDCRAEFDDTPIVRGFNLDLLWQGVVDDGKTKTAEWFDGIIRFALLALSSPRKKVLCHCAGGIHRGPAAAYAVLRAQGLKRFEAKRLIMATWPRAELIYQDDADAAVKLLGYE